MSSRGKSSFGTLAKQTASRGRAIVKARPSGSTLPGLLTLGANVQASACRDCKSKLAVLIGSSCSIQDVVRTVQQTYFCFQICLEGNQLYCPMCFGQAHADSRRSRHTTETIIFDHGSFVNDCLGNNNSWFDEAEDTGISGQKLKDERSFNHTEYLGGGNLLEGEYDENGAREDFAQVVKAFRSASSASKAEEQSRYSNLVILWNAEVSRFPSVAGFKSVEKLSEPRNNSRFSTFGQQTDAVSSRPVEEKVNAVLWTGDATVEHTREKLAQFLRETRGKFPSNTRPAALPEEPALHVQLPPEASPGVEVSVSAPISGASNSDVDIKRDKPKTSSTVQAVEEEQQRRNLSQLLTFSGIRTKLETRKLNGGVKKPNTGITITPVTRPSSANVTTLRPTSSSRPLLGSYKKEPLSQLPPHSARKDIKQVSATPRSSVGPSRQPGTNNSERMRTPARALHHNLTKMLDIDLPRITITSDNYGSGASAKKGTLTRTRSVSRHSVKQQQHGAQALSFVGPSVPILDVRSLLTPSSADFVHNSSTLYQHTTSSLSRSRSSSFSRGSSPSSPRPLTATKIAVISMSPHLSKSPSLDLKPVERSTVSFSRAASVDREPVEDSTLLPSSINKSSSTGSFNKLTLPLPGPTVVARRHSTKSSGHSPRIMSVTPRSPSPSPVMARPLSASRISSPTSHQSNTKRFCSPVVKAPFVVTRPRSYTTNPSQLVSRNDHRRPSERIVTSLDAEPLHPSATTTYDRNLKKFYTWCNHCKRVQRAASLTPATNRGFSAGTVPLSKGNSQTVRAIRKLSVGVRPNTMRSPRPSLKYSPSFGYTPSDPPLRSPVVPRKRSMTPTPGPQRQGSIEVPRKTSTGFAVKERPKSACTPSDSVPIGTDHPHHKSLFDFDNLSAEQVDSIWMYADNEDPLNSDDDFYYDLDVETMSVKSESSIVICCITCDTKLKDESDDTEPDCSKMPLRKAFSNNS